MIRWLAIVLLALGFAPSTAGAVSVGVGVFGGANIPIVQDDNGKGSTFGLRVPVALLPLITLEPSFNSTRDGDASQVISGISYTRSGFDITSYGLNAMLTFGGRLQFYPLVGLSTNSLTRTGSQDLTLSGFNFGLGLGFSPIQKLSIHLRGEGNSLSKSGSGRTFANVTVGASYNVFDFAAKGGAK